MTPPKRLPSESPHTAAPHVDCGCSQRRAAKQDPQLLRLKDVASRLQVNIRTLQAWIAAGRLHVIRLSPRAVRVSEEALAEFVKRASESGS